MEVIEINDVPNASKVNPTSYTFVKRGSAAQACVSYFGFSSGYSTVHDVTVGVESRVIGSDGHTVTISDWGYKTDDECHHASGTINILVIADCES